MGFDKFQFRDGAPDLLKPILMLGNHVLILLYQILVLGSNNFSLVLVSLDALINFFYRHFLDFSSNRIIAS